MSAIRKFNHGRQVTYRYNEIDSIKVFKRKGKLIILLRYSYLGKLFFLKLSLFLIDIIVQEKYH